MPGLSSTVPSLPTTETGQPPDRAGASGRRVVLDVLLILSLFGLAGAGAGVLWERLWTPPAGVAYQQAWVLDGDGLTHDFAGTGIYAALAVGLGLVLGLVVAWLIDRNEVATLVAITAGSVLAGWLMYVVGVHLGPPDPQIAARTAEDLTAIPGALEVHGKGAFLAWPFGSLAGASAVFLLVLRGHDHD